MHTHDIDLFVNYLDYDPTTMFVELHAHLLSLDTETLNFAVMLELVDTEHDTSETLEISMDLARKLRDACVTLNTAYVATGFLTCSIQVGEDIVLSYDYGCWWIKFSNKDNEMEANLGDASCGLQRLFTTLDILLGLSNSLIYPTDYGMNP